jgi:hypothetical protein
MQNCLTFARKVAMTAKPTDPIVLKLHNTGYKLTKQNRDRIWNISLQSDSAFEWDMGKYQARTGSSYKWNNGLALMPTPIHQTTATTRNSYAQDYARWHSRLLVNLCFKDDKQVKLAVEEQYQNLLAYRSKLKNLPANFNRLGEANKNKLILPFFLSATPIEVTDYALSKQMTAYHPVINGLAEKIITMVDLPDHENLPREWSRKLIFG